MTKLNVMAQSIPSIPIPPPPHPLGICKAFIIFLVGGKLQMPQGVLGGSYKNPTVGLKKVRMQVPHLGTTTTLHFPVNELQMPYF